MTYRQRFSLLIFVDSVIVLTAVFFSRLLMSANLRVLSIPLIITAITLLASHHFFSFRYNLYKRAWEYASIGELYHISKAVTFSILTAAVVQLIVVQDIYLRLLTITWMFHLLLIGGTRFSWRVYRDAFIKKPDNKKGALIVGAGSAGTVGWSSPAYS